MTSRLLFVLMVKDDVMSVWLLAPLAVGFLSFFGVEYFKNRRNQKQLSNKFVNDVQNILAKQDSGQTLQPETLECDFDKPITVTCVKPLSLDTCLKDDPKYGGLKQSDEFVRRVKISTPTPKVDAQSASFTSFKSNDEIGRFFYVLNPTSEHFFVPVVGNNEIRLLPPLRGNKFFVVRRQHHGNGKVCQCHKKLNHETHKWEGDCPVCDAYDLVADKTFSYLLKPEERCYYNILSKGKVFIWSVTEDIHKRIISAIVGSPSGITVVKPLGDVTDVVKGRNLVLHHTSGSPSTIRFLEPSSIESSYDRHCFDLEAIANMWQKSQYELQEFVSEISAKTPALAAIISDTKRENSQTEQKTSSSKFNDDWNAASEMASYNEWKKRQPKSVQAVTPEYRKNS